MQDPAAAQKCAAVCVSGGGSARPRDPRIHGGVSGAQHLPLAGTPVTRMRQGPHPVNKLAAVS